MCGRSRLAHFFNDHSDGGQDARTFLRGLIQGGIEADAVLFDPPYSPRQLGESYRQAKRTPTQADTQNGRLYREVRELLNVLLVPGGVALSFGWQSAGFGRAWITDEILLVQHGGAHSDTICVAQRKPLTDHPRGTDNG